MIAQKNRTGYTDIAPEKDGAGLGGSRFTAHCAALCRGVFIVQSPLMGGECSGHRKMRTFREPCPPTRSLLPTILADGDRV